MRTDGARLGAWMGLGWSGGGEAGSRDFILDLNCGQCTPSQLVRCHQTSTNQVMDEKIKYKKEHQGGKNCFKKCKNGDCGGRTSGGYKR